jgi:hypothetical protein
MKILRSLTVIGVGAALAFGVAATPASAAKSDPVLVASASRGGPCSGSANASWNRAANVVTINSTAHSSYAFAACRLKVVLDWTATGWPVGYVTRDIPTACALTDPTCSSTSYEYGFRQGNNVAPFAVPFTDTLTMTLVTR